MPDSPIHPTATIDPGATIGASTRIWHYCHVMSGAVIGENSMVGQGCFVASGARIGNGVRIQNNVSIYDGVEIEDEVFVGPSAVFTNVKHPRAHASKKHAFEKTTVGRGATIGANATIVCGVNLGAHCFVAAGAVVTDDVPPFALVAGVPARRDAWVCRCGERLIFDNKGKAACAVTGERYELRGESVTLRALHI